MKKVSLIIPCYNEEQALPIFAGEAGQGETGTQAV